MARRNYNVIINELLDTRMRYFISDLICSFWRFESFLFIDMITTATTIKRDKTTYQRNVGPY